MFCAPRGVTAPPTVLFSAEHRRSRPETDFASIQHMARAERLVLVEGPAARQEIKGFRALGVRGCMTNFVIQQSSRFPLPLPSQKCSAHIIPGHGKYCQHAGA